MPTRDVCPDAHTPMGVLFLATPSLGTMIQWIWTRKLSIKISLSLARAHGALGGGFPCRSVLLAENPRIILLVDVTVPSQAGYAYMSHWLCLQTPAMPTHVHAPMVVLAAARQAAASSARPAPSAIFASRLRCAQPSCHHHFNRAFRAMHSTPHTNGANAHRAMLPRIGV